MTPKHEKQCSFCQKDFRSSRAAAKFCSTSCRCKSHYSHTQKELTELRKLRDGQK